MDLTFVDKLASQNKGVKYLLVAVDIFSRFVRVQTMKTKYAKDTLQYFITNHSRNNLNKNSKLVIELELRKMIFRSEKDTSHSLQMKFLKFRQYLQKNLLNTSSKISQKKES